MSSKYQSQATATLNGDAAENGDSVVDGEIADVLTRIGDAVVVLSPSRDGAMAGETWVEGPDRAEVEEVEVEKEAVPLEEQEGIDDPVRMYLREIGKVYLLSGADEKRLARHMEEAKHIEAIERRWLDAKHRLPFGQEILLSLIGQYFDDQKAVRFICKDLGVKAALISDLVQNETWRGTVDAEMDLELAGRLAAHMHSEQVEAEQSIIRLSIITHILQPEHIKAIATYYGGEKALLPPPLDAMTKRCKEEDALREYFHRLKFEGHRAESMEELDRALAASLASRGPKLIDVVL